MRRLSNGNILLQTDGDRLGVERNIEQQFRIETLDVVASAAHITSLKNSMMVCYGDG